MIKRFEVLLAVAVAALAFQLSLPSIQSALNAPRPGVQTAVQATGSLTSEDGTVWNSLGYLLFLPKDYRKRDDMWPLLVFLHGSGSRGTDLELVKKDGGPPCLVEQDKNFPFIVLSPQCPAGQRWQSQQLMALIDQIASDYRVDPDRICVTGFSMGGFGTWDLAQAYPERFAAIAPVCGGGDPSKAERLRNLPCWVFHGAIDEVVPVAKSQAMVDAVRAAGGEVNFTVYPEAGHDSWTLTYGNPELYDWLLAQRRKRGMM